MNYIKQIVLIVLILIGNLSLYSQEDYPNCTNPHEVSIPISSDVVEEKIYYQLEDKYTYWYKVTADADCQLNYGLNLIDKDDSYSLLIYNFKGGSFCNEVKKHDPISIKSEGQLDAAKGQTYYFGVLHLNGYGCGHTMSLETAGVSRTFKAIQNECMEEAIEVIVELEEKNKKPVVIEKVKGSVINSNTQKRIFASIDILDEENVVQQQVNSAEDAGFVLDYLPGGEIIVSIKKFGYDNYIDTLELTAEDLIIKLNPIKVGEKLVMHKIYFHPNTYVLKEEFKVELEKLNKFMLENINYTFEIQGHTNGNRTVKKTKRYAHLSEEWNFKGTAKKLSKMRAEKIKSYLIKNGVEESKIQTEGYGGDKMIVVKPKNMREAMKNIRVEVIVVK